MLLRNNSPTKHMASDYNNNNMDFDNNANDDIWMKKMGTRPSPSPINFNDPTYSMTPSTAAPQLHRVQWVGFRDL